MIGIELKGGIGNILFQIAFIESLGHKHGVDVCYHNINEWVRTCPIPSLGWSPNPREILGSFPYIEFYANQNKKDKITESIDVPFNFTNITFTDNTLYHGYFQSEYFFNDNYLIKAILSPSREIGRYLRKYADLFIRTTCSIHVRRGNYLNFPTHHPVLDMEYYNNAIKLMRKLAVIDQFIIYSNDIEWCKDNFVGKEFVFVEEMDYIALHLMSMSPYHIIANSSFSWWGAYLKEIMGRTIVIAPCKWFGSSLPEDFDKDLVPERWIRI